MCGTEPLQPMASDHIASYLEPSLWCIYLHVSSLMHASQKVTHCAFLKWKELHFFSYLKVSDSLGWMDSLFWNFKLPDSPWQYGCLSHHCLVMQQISLETSSMPWDVHSAIEKTWYKKYINTMPREQLSYDLEIILPTIDSRRQPHLSFW